MIVGATILFNLIINHDGIKKAIGEQSKNPFS
jgi:hypothetical protein